MLKYMTKKGGENIMKKVFYILLGIVLLATAVSVQAAAPDGLGPWADTVVNSTQGNTKGGQPVSVARSDPTAALGVAEDDTVDAHFFSLGFGGKITLGFDNGISSGVFVVEATNAGYPSETALVEVSQDGATWYPAGTVTQDGQVALPYQVSCGKFVRIIDTSNPNNFPDSTADAYDVDGVQARGNSCTTTGRMTGGGSVFTRDNVRVTHGFELHCSPTDGPNNLEINWDKGNKFHLDTLTKVLCTDDPSITQSPPKAGFDTYIGKGTGSFNGKSGYTADWTFVDAGEPGKNDSARIVIKDPSNAVVLTVSGLLDKGNQQAH